MPVVSTLNKDRDLEIHPVFCSFFVLVPVTQLPGGLSLLYRAIFSVPATFVAAGTLTC